MSIHSPRGDPSRAAAAARRPPSRSRSERAPARDPCRSRGSRSAAGGRAPARQREEQHVVLAAAERQSERIAAEASQSAAKRSARGSVSGLDLRAGRALAAEPVEVAARGRPRRRSRRPRLTSRASGRARAAAAAAGAGARRAGRPPRAAEAGRAQAAARRAQPREPRAAASSSLPGGRLADRSAQPEHVAGRGAAAAQPARRLRGLSSEQRERRGHGCGMLREVAAGERRPCSPQAASERGEEPAVIETRRGREGEEGIGRRGAHGGEIREVDREQPARDQRRSRGPAGKCTPAIWLSTVTAQGPPAGSTAASSPISGSRDRRAAASGAAGLPMSLHAVAG